MNPYALLAEVLAAVGFLVLAGLGVKAYNESIRSEAVLSDRAQAAEVVASEEKAARQRADKLRGQAEAAAARRAKERDDARRNLEQLWKNYGELAAQDKGTSDWLSTPVPDGIRRLRESGSSASRGDSAVVVRVPPGAAGAAAGSRP